MTDIEKSEEQEEYELKCYEWIILIIVIWLIAYFFVPYVFDLG